MTPEIAKVTGLGSSLIQLMLPILNSSCTTASTCFGEEVPAKVRTMNMAERNASSQSRHVHAPRRASRHSTQPPDPASADDKIAVIGNFVTRGSKNKERLVRGRLRSYKRCQGKSALGRQCWCGDPAAL